MTEATYKLLTRVHSWPAFSNHTTAPPGVEKNTNSLEAIHDRIHSYVGGNGHMGDPAVAGVTLPNCPDFLNELLILNFSSGFDPIFFLHHANVDRLLTLWSAIHSTIWVTEGPAQGGTWTIPAGSIVDKDSGMYRITAIGNNVVMTQFIAPDLTPFRATQSRYWTSATLLATSELGYTYAEFNNVDPTSRDSILNKIAPNINERYGGSVFRHFEALEPESQRVNDWAARIRFKKYELGHGFAVLIFLGEVPADVREWRLSSNLVGTHVAFVNSAADQCANCSGQMDVEIEGFVHLNSAIASQLSSTVLGSFEPNAIVNYLRKNIHWRVQAVRFLSRFVTFVSPHTLFIFSRLTGLRLRSIDSRLWKLPLRRLA